MSVYMDCWFPAEQTTEENDAVHMAHTLEAANKKTGMAKSHIIIYSKVP